MLTQYYARLRSYLAKSEFGSLAEIIAKNSPHAGVYPEDKVTQWLFAFDGGAMTAFRALALLAAFPDKADGAEADIAAWHAENCNLPYLRAAFVEAVRLFPTTPALLRQSTRATRWGNMTLPAETSIVMYLPFFHRDSQFLPEVDRFMPEQWLDKDPASLSPFVPFSAGQTACPGRQLVSLLGSFWLASLMEGGSLQLLNAGAIG
jgi:cytochrome P450